ncbi:hypothetical protein UA08_04435 [Talaromyces atroroseus]|uniref:Estradiol 17-beta-dehydrogenase 11 n=1 Tax=Talaromyces atroroseus TaxID=1441469 RepID=A0A1Q5Q9D0_TALAT|nr:hypothetical protein UA08_04435 [Talaromyces atroroseus]OKL60724.1 hypothetical protein UA08_04435 [Talaromyces atroroseus]
MVNRILPREGFTADVLVSTLRHTVFDPFKTLAAVLVLHYVPQLLNGSIISSHLPLHKRESALSYLRIALALGLVGSVNSWIGRRVLNRHVKDKYDWPREIVVVTGGSHGFGKETVLILAARAKGVRIAVLDVVPPDYEYDGDSVVKFFHCDITNVDAIAVAAAEIRAVFGGDPTVLINNAGVIYARPLLENTEREISMMFEVNAVSQYKLLNEFLPAMVSHNHGMVVTVSSQGGNCTTPGMTAYCATKAATIGLHEGLTSELAIRYNAPRVRTVLVTPAFAKTFVTRDLIPEDSFLSPLLEPATVAEAMINQILKGESGYVGVGVTGNWFTSNLRSTPLWWQTGFRDWMGNTTKKPKTKHPWVQREVE